MESVYFVIHSFDKLVQRVPDFKNYLLNLVKHTRDANSESTQVRFIASIDHLKSSCMFTDEFLDELNAIFFQVSTYEEYDIEKLYAPNLFAASSDLQEIGVEYILKSMTKDQIFVIKAIAKYMLGYPEEPGISISSLYNECCDEINLTATRQLKQYLSEAKDHKLVLERRSEDDQVYLYINHSRSILENILNFNT